MTDDITLDDFTFRRRPEGLVFAGDWEIRSQHGWHLEFDIAVIAALNEIERLRAENEAMKRGFEDMAAKVAHLRALVTKHRIHRLRQIAATKRWRAEAKELRRLMRVTAGDHLDDHTPDATWVAWRNLFEHIAKADGRYEELIKVHTTNLDPTAVAKAVKAAIDNKRRRDQVADPYRPTPPTCDVSRDGRRCDLTLGHDGPHAWINNEPPHIVKWGYT